MFPGLVRSILPRVRQSHSLYTIRRAIDNTRLKKLGMRPTPKFL